MTTILLVSFYFFPVSILRLALSTSFFSKVCSSKKKKKTFLITVRFPYTHQHDPHKMEKYVIYSIIPSQDS